MGRATPPPAAQGAKDHAGTAQGHPPHHAVTMARMDRLFGVTMVEQGVSQLVSVDLKKAEALVA